MKKNLALQRSNLDNLTDELEQSKLKSFTIARSHWIGLTLLQKKKKSPFGVTNINRLARYPIHMKAATKFPHGNPSSVSPMSGPHVNTPLGHSIESSASRCSDESRGWVTKMPSPRSRGQFLLGNMIKVRLFQLQSYFGEITQILTLNWQDPLQIWLLITWSNPPLHLKKYGALPIFVPHFSFDRSGRWWRRSLGHGSMKASNGG